MRQPNERLKELMAHKSATAAEVAAGTHKPDLAYYAEKQLLGPNLKVLQTAFHSEGLGRDTRWLTDDLMRFLHGRQRVPPSWTDPLPTVEAMRARVAKRAAAAQARPATLDGYFHKKPRGPPQ